MTQGIVATAVLLVATLIGSAACSAGSDEAPDSDAENSVNMSASTPIPSAPTEDASSATPPPTAASPTTPAEEDLSALIESSLVGFAFLPENLDAGRYSDYVIVDFEHRNVSDRTIRAVTGVAVFKDLFGREIRTVRLTYDDSIEPGSTASDTGRALELNQFMESDNQLKSKTIDQLIFEFDVTAILWENGDLLGEVPDAYVAPSGESRESLADLVSVELLELTLVPENWSAGRYSDYLWFVFDYTSGADQDIRAFTGQAVFLDLFGREIKRLGLTYDDVLPAGVSVQDADKSFELNQFMAEDQQLAATDLADLRFVFEVDSVILADGTLLGQAR
ncbi:MAG: hypothetical protein AB7F65_00860 [Dehalococcoidia bacterium]